MALIGKSSIGGRLCWSDIGRKQAAGRVQPRYDAICVRRQTDEPTKTASETLPRYPGEPCNRADLEIRLRHERREWYGLPTASQGICRRNLVRRPDGEPVSIHPFAPLQPARRGEDVQPSGGQQVSRRTHVQIQADCAERI